MSENIPFFEIFPWGENFEVGIESIDEEHKKLVEILNRLAFHLANNSEEIVLNDIFTELANYADYHFKSEEKIWSEFFLDDDAYSKHHETHISFIDEVVALKENKDNKPLDDVIFDIVSFLSQWLAYHILDADKRMALAVINMKNGASITQAKENANEEMMKSKVLVNTVLSMYSSLSTRTLDLMREKAKRMQAEEKLRSSEDRWKVIIDGGSANVWDWDIESNEISRSQNDLAIFNVVDENTASNIHPADLKQFELDLDMHLKGSTEFFINKHRVALSNGGWSWVLSRGKVVERTENGVAKRMVGTHSDITEQELASLIYKNSSQAMFISDAQNNIIGINPAFTKVTGFSEEDVIGKNPKVLASGEHDKKFYEVMWGSIKKDGKWSGEINNKRKDGVVYPELLNINSVLNENGKVDHYIALFHDISSEKEKESLLLQQSRLAQIGEMISMIAHQWRQPLSAISAVEISLQTVLLMQKYDLETPEGRVAYEENAIGQLQKIGSIVQNLSQTINDFRDFYKPSKRLEVLSINQPVKKALTIIGASLHTENVKLIHNHDEDFMVKIHENEIMQVILNLLKNAQDNFIIKEIQAPEIIISTVKKGTKIELSIADNGGGIDEMIIDKIFDPYFSTKEEQNGRGLGLYMSKKIMNGLKGAQLKVNNIENGVCFTLSFDEVCSS